METNLTKSYRIFINFKIMLHGIWKENMQVKERIYKESTSIGRGIFYQCRFAYNSLMIMDFQIVDRLVS